MPAARRAPHENPDDEREPEHGEIMIGGADNHAAVLAAPLFQAIALGVFAGGRALIEYHQRNAIPAPTGSVEPQAPPNVMSADETAAFLGLDRNTVYDAAGRGDIPHRRIGKRLLFSRAQLVSWLGACKAASGRNG